MNAWIPVAGTPRARLVEQAMVQFGRRGYENVAVADVARAAGVTTGALYHHFGSKAGLYDLVRTEVERRVRDHMDGAGAVPGSSLQDVLRVGFEAAWTLEAARMLAESPPVDRSDRLADFIIRRGDRLHPGLGPILVGAWQAALAESVRDGAQEPARSALVALLRGIEPETQGG